MKTRNSNLKIIIIVIAAAVILAAVGFVIYKAVDRFINDEDGGELKCPNCNSIIALENYEILENNNLLVECLQCSEKNEIESNATQANVTLFKLFMGRTITDSDIDEIRETVAGAVGAAKVLEVKKGASFSFPDVYDDEGNIMDMGDGVDIIFSLLDTDEKGNAFGALAEKYGITPEHLVGGVRDIYRGDFAGG